MSPSVGKPYLDHIKSGSDLKTSYVAYRAGFVSLALEKSRRATPFVDEARKLKVIAAQVHNPTDLLHLKEIRQALLVASGVSDKAYKYLQESNQDEAISGLIAKYLEPAGADFVEELVFRFLLTRGDSLGGSMRNVGGILAQRKLTRSIISYLNLSGTKYWWVGKQRKEWTVGESSADDADVELGVTGLAWTSDVGHRILVYNLNVPAVQNNIDICLFDSSYETHSRLDVEAPGRYLALGELKGGIDPAGADEHWKTARTALERIRKGFAGYHPATFFIGAAIETKMAEEIWSFLEDGTLSNAANMTDENQFSSIVRWLCTL